VAQPINQIGELPVPDKSMKRLLLLLFVLLALAVLAESEKTAQQAERMPGRPQISGKYLLQSVQQHHPEPIRKSGIRPLSGDQELEWWLNLTNGSANLSDRNGSNNLSNWESPLRPQPGLSIPGKTMCFFS